MDVNLSVNCIFVKIQTAERKVDTVVVEIVVMSEQHGSFTLLCKDFEQNTLPDDLYHGSVDDLPTQLKIKHINYELKNGL